MVKNAIVVLLLVLSVSAKSQVIAKLYEGEKVIRSFETGTENFSFIYNLPAKHDTVLSIAVNGTLNGLCENGLEIMDYSKRSDYFVQNKQVNVYIDEDNYVNTLTVPVENLSNIILVPGIKKAGDKFMSYGALIFALSPLVGLDFKEGFKFKRYQVVAGLGVGLFAVGFTFDLSCKKRLYQIKEGPVSEKPYKRYKIIKPSRFEIYYEN